MAGSLGQGKQQQRRQEKGADLNKVLDRKDERRAEDQPSQARWLWGLQVTKRSTDI